ncbi:MAG: hypothetical protein ABSF38_06085 [Verrucomicrobiota bacterium]|jgi:hypothetical protein
MKTKRFLFMLIAFGSLTLGLCYADDPSRQPAEPASPAKPGTSGDHATGPALGHPLPADHLHAKGNHDGHLPPTNDPAGPWNHQPKPAPPNQAHQPALNRPPSGAKNGWIVNSIGTRQEPPAKLPPGAGTVAPLPGVAVGPSADAPVLGKFTTGGSILKKTGDQPLAKFPAGGGTAPPGPGGVRGRGVKAALIGASLGVAPKKTTPVAHGADIQLKP